MDLRTNGTMDHIRDLFERWCGLDTMETEISVADERGALKAEIRKTHWPEFMVPDNARDREALAWFRREKRNL